MGGMGHYVLIHDGARPLLSAGQITDCLKGAAGHDGAMPVLPMRIRFITAREGSTWSGF